MSRVHIVDDESQIDEEVPPSHANAIEVGSDVNNYAQLNEFMELWQSLTRTQNSFCCGCASPEILLACMTIFWVLIAFYEGLRDYEIKHYEAIIIYMLAFCIFAALVSGKLRFFIIAFIICLLEMMWNVALLHLLVYVYIEMNNEKNGPPEMTRYLARNWSSILVFVKRMINEDFYSFVVVYLLKIIYVFVILILSLHVRRIQQLEVVLRRQRRRMGYILNRQMRAANEDHQVLPSPFSPTAFCAEPIAFEGPSTETASDQRSLEAVTALSRTSSLVTATEGLSETQSLSESSA